MFAFDIKKHVPAFIMRDKNGYALAKAIETGINAMNNIIKDSVALISGIDTMPVWRLDELAWEYDALYDFSGSIEEKRKWIKLALNNQIYLGTPEAVVKYLNARYWYVYVNDRTGDPFNYKVYVKDDNQTTDTSWAEGAAEKTGNVRSVPEITSGLLKVAVPMSGGIEAFYEWFSARGDMIYTLRLSDGTSVKKHWSEEYTKHFPGHVLPGPLFDEDEHVVYFTNIPFFGIEGDKEARIETIELVEIFRNVPSQSGLRDVIFYRGSVSNMSIIMYRKNGNVDEYFRSFSLGIIQQA